MEKDVARSKEPVDPAFPQPTDQTCPICLDTCNKTSTIDCCKHIFCFLCISAWGKITPTCPLCKLSFKMAKCKEMYSSDEQIFLPPAALDMANFEEATDILDLDDEDRSNIAHTYHEMDDFIVASEDLDSDDYDEETEADRILDMADEVLLPRKRRKLPPRLSESSLYERTVAVHFSRPSYLRSHGNADPLPAESSSSSLTSFDAFAFHSDIKSAMTISKGQISPLRLNFHLSP